MSTDSHFWNASGLHISGGLQNFDIKAQSIQSMLAGGIAFDIGPENDKSPPKNGDTFQLYTNKNVQLI